MTNETRQAVQKAFEIGKVLFRMGPANFNELASITNKIPQPTKAQLRACMETYELGPEEAMAKWFQKMYAATAVKSGFTKDQGEAMLVYAAMLKEIKNG